jgi:hypothetical protein
MTGPAVQLILPTVICPHPFQPAANYRGQGPCCERHTADRMFILPSEIGRLPTEPENMYRTPATCTWTLRDGQTDVEEHRATLGLLPVHASVMLLSMQNQAGFSACSRHCGE